MNINLKVALLGDGAVGKTSLVRQYVESAFSEEYITTTGAVKSKVEFTINLPILQDPLDVKLMLTDIHGQREDISQGLIQSHLKGSDGAIIVFDVTRQETYDNIPNWLSDLFEATKDEEKEDSNREPEVPYILMGNKIDMVLDYMALLTKGEVKAGPEEFKEYLEKQNPGLIEGYERLGMPDPRFKLVDFARFEAYCKEIGIPDYRTSAKSGMNVEAAFRIIARTVAEKKLLQNKETLLRRLEEYEGDPSKKRRLERTRRNLEVYA